MLFPSAFVLNNLPDDRDLGLIFYGVQAVELIGGAAIIFWLSQNMKGVLMLSGHLARKKNNPV